jgi:hypothetical protein
MAYAVILTFHSYWRWALVVVGVIVFGRSCVEPHLSQALGRVSCSALKYCLSPRPQS